MLETRHISKIGGQFDTGIKWHADRLQHRLFQREDLGDGGILSWVPPRAQFPAAGGKPGVQCRKVCKAWRGRQQPLPHMADLVLDLACATGLEPVAPTGAVPTRSRGAGPFIEAPLTGWMAPAPGVAMRHYGVIV